MVEISVVEISQRTVATMVGHLEIKVKIVATLVETKEIEVEVEEDLIPVQMSEGLEWLVRPKIKIKVDVSTIISLDTSSGNAL